jgi:multiple sugar transport system permease protein
VIVPFLWLFLSSLKPNVELISGNSFLPKEWTLQNYVTVFTEIPMLGMLRNSVFVAVLATTGGLFASAMGAFVFAKLRFPGKNVLFTLVLVTMMVPGVVTMIPLYIIIFKVGLVDSLWALILPHWTGSAFAVFFLRQHMLAIPQDLYDASKMDGCSPGRSFLTIYLPLVKPALATLAVLNFMYHWNELMSPLIYLNSPEKMTVTVGLSYFRGQYVSDYAVILAGVFVSLTPTFIIFLAAQKYLTRGMLLTGLK